MDGYADLEPRVPGNRREIDGAAHFPDETMNRVETESGAVAHALGRKKRLEDARLNLLGDTGAIVGNFNENIFAFARNANPQRPFVLHGIGGIVDEIRPDLIQLTAVGGDLRNVRRKVANHGNSFA